MFDYMVTINTDTPTLGIAFAGVLDVDAIRNLKEGFGMMGMRFTGRPAKAGIVKAYDEYVKGHPADVLRCLRPEELEMVDGILKQGKGGHVTVKGTRLYNQLQKMNLVLTREDDRAGSSNLYLIDELHDLFAPHIGAVMANPVDYHTDRTMKTPLDAVLFEISCVCRELDGHIGRWTRYKHPVEMTEGERGEFAEALDRYDEVLEEYGGRLTSLEAVTPRGFGPREDDIVRMKETLKNMHDAVGHMRLLLEAADGGTVDGTGDIIGRFMKDRMDAVEAAEKAEKEGPFRHLPAFTRHPAGYPAAAGSCCATRLVRPRIFEVTLPLEDGLYFVAYFCYMGQNGYTQATCYWGNIFDFAEKAASEPYPGAGYVVLSKPFRRKYPHIAGVYGIHEDNERGEKPYLTTIGWDHQPKQWYLSMRLYGFDYARLVACGPLDCPGAIEAVDTLCRMSLSMAGDIRRSDAKSPRLLMNAMFGL